MNSPRFRLSASRHVLKFAALTLMTCHITSAQLYDAAKDFSLTHNPNGSWRYGSAPGLNSPFELANIPVSFAGTPIAGWSSSDAAPGYPFALTAAFNFQWGTSVFAPGWLSLHPDSLGSYSVVKWIAPSGGIYHVNSLFDSFNSSASGQLATVDVHVRLNQKELWSQVLGPQQEGAASFLALNLNPGDHVDFMVGSNGPSDFDNVGFQATVTYASPFVPVPEPPTFGLLGAFSLAAYSFIRRRRNLAR